MKLFIYFILIINVIKYAAGNYCWLDHFMIENMTSCHPLLNCDDIKEIKVLNSLSDEGNVKNIYLSQWKEFKVVLVKPKNNIYLDDFKSGLNLLKLFNNSQYVTKLIGFCDATNTYVTKYYKYGDARNILKTLKENKLDNMEKRIGLCLNYVKILNFLHIENSINRFVFCDSNDLMKLLSQLLIDDDLNLIMNDLDALPAIESEGKIICGKRELSGIFVAPEQIHSKGAKNIGYNEKIDIWRVPNVCNYFIKDHDQYDLFKFYVFDIHKNCKHTNPMNRPTALQLVYEYDYLLKQFKYHDDL